MIVDTAHPAPAAAALVDCNTVAAASTPGAAVTTLRLTVVPLQLREANDFVLRHHRHRPPARGCSFCIGVVAGDVLAGVAICGRPVARGVNFREVIEVTRLATDGTKNACSMLYGRAARIAREMGYTRIQTYTLASEPGTTLRAAGWVCDGLVTGRDWLAWERGKHRFMWPTEDKRRWVKEFRHD